MSGRMVQAIDFIAFTALVVAGLMIAAGVARSQDPVPASARKIDRPAVTVAIMPPATTVADTAPAERTTTLIRAVAPAY